MKLYRLTEKKYLKNPEKWDIRFVGWDTKRKPYAMAEKREGKNILGFPVFP